MSESFAERLLAGLSGQQQALPGASHPWVAALRRDALTRFRELGLPGARNEAWKYTRLNALERRSFQPADPAVALPDLGDLLAAAPPLRAVFVNGRFRAEASALAGLPAGARLCPLAEALEQDDGTLRERLAGGVVDEDAFGALNAAFIGDGLLLELAADCVLEQPLLLLFVSIAGDDYVSHPRNIVVAGRHSRATVLEAYVGPQGGSYFTNASTELYLAPGARLDHLRRQDEAAGAFHLGRVRARVERDAGYRSQVFSLGAQLARLDLDVHLGQGAECDLDGLYLAAKRQHVDHQTRVEHAAPHGRSAEYYKGVIDDAARAVFSGTVLVQPDAQKTDAQQMNRNLLLSPRAEVDTKPQLVIYADDVKCAHGATIGQLDPVEMFYLRSRGLDETAARELLIHAFANELVDRVADDGLRAFIFRCLDARLPGREPLLEGE
ncbi:MAG TPA: Fe-S cluster assembly protein SufD [Gammaproteobacteria bacterium]